LYARVSTRTQVNDLETQIDFLGNAHPEGLSRTLPVE
jgi:predicted site-specific integrase-resolvase